MATFENNPDTVACPHCGSPVRVGMIRCRECRGLLVEAAPDFVLAPQVAAVTQRTCPRCNAPLDPGVDDCPSCESALIDELMKGPAQQPESPAAPSRSNPAAS